VSDRLSLGPVFLLSPADRMAALAKSWCAIPVSYPVQRVRRRGNRARRKGGFAGLIGVDRSAARRADWQADIAHGDNRRHARAVWPTVRHEVPLQRRQPIERPHCSGVPLWQVPPAVIFVLPSHWPRACRLFGP
jgi:hypothetical protein